MKNHRKTRRLKNWRKSRKSRKQKMSGGNSKIVGVVLDNASQALLKASNFDYSNYQIWNSCHHVTIRFNEGFIQGDPDKSTAVQIQWNMYGFNNNACALKVESMIGPDGNNIKFAESEKNNKTFHITVRHLNKFDAVKSNEITEWKELKEPLFLFGKVSLFNNGNWDPNIF